MSLVAAIDVGGTFTDITLASTASSRMWVVKTPTTPGAPAQGFLHALREALRVADGEPSDVSRLLHATTIATNAILESRGARTALLTTRGFKDVLGIGRHDVPRGKNIHTWVKPARPVPPWLVYEIDERIDSRGEVVAPLDEDRCRAVALELRGAHVDSIAICFLSSFVNPAHERRVREIFAEALPGASVSLSSETLPVFREYERTVATVLNAYVAPAVASHLDRLESSLRDNLACAAPLHIMKSNGGVVQAREAHNQPIHTALSGPAAGVIGAQLIARTVGLRDLITIDVGGTSSDVCLIRDGRATTTTTGQIGNWPFAAPMIDVSAIGAGGGSIANVSALGVLSIGPESAGALPGPACYKSGGERPTITDAQLALGRLPAALLGGAVSLDVEASWRAIHDHVAVRLGISDVAAAAGILEIANDRMVGAIRVLTVERGHDPFGLHLLAFGGSGPLHGAALGDRLGTRSVVIPPDPGVLSTLGLLASSVRNDFMTSSLVRDPLASSARIYERLLGLQDQAVRWLADEEVAPDDRHYEWQLDLRYPNQIAELTVPMPRSCDAALGVRRTLAKFHVLHQELYGHSDPESPVEVVNCRVVAWGDLPAPELPEIAAARAAPSAASARPVYFAELADYVECPVYARSDLGAGSVLTGPAVIEQYDTTTIVLPRQRASVEAHGVLLIEPAATTSLNLGV